MRALSKLGVNFLPRFPLHEASGCFKIMADCAFSGKEHRDEYGRKAG
jgi:hypothetical protein